MDRELHSTPGANYWPGPEQYTLGVFRPWIEQAASLEEREMLPSLVTLARVALEKADMPAYDEWKQYIAEYVDDKLISPAVRHSAQYYHGCLAELYTWGTAHRDASSKQQLELLIKSGDTDFLDPVLQWCAQQDKDPEFWIDMAVAGGLPAGKQLEVWDEYVYARRGVLDARCQQAQDDRLLMRARQRTVEAYLHWEVDDSVALSMARFALEAAVGELQKQEIIARVGDAVKRFAEDGTLRVEQADALTMFSAAVCMDWEIPESTKIDFDDLAFHYFGPCLHIDPEINQVRHLAREFAWGNDVDDLMIRIEQVGNIAESEADQQQLRDKYYRETSIALAAKATILKRDGMVYNAATAVSTMARLLSCIEDNNEWMRTIWHYVGHDGDVDSLRFWESREVSRKLESEVPDVGIRLALRSAVLTFLEALGKGTPGEPQSYALADQALEALAKYPAASSSTRSTDKAILVQCIERLLQVNPTSAYRGMELIGALDASCDKAPVYNLFTAYGAPGVTEANWRRLQRMPRQNYLSAYAGVLAASVFSER